MESDYVLLDGRFVTMLLRHWELLSATELWDALALKYADCTKRSETHSSILMLLSCESGQASGMRLMP